MKKIFIGFVFLMMILIFVNIVFAEGESVSFNVTENETNSSYTVNIDIQISGNDTHVRDDVYGTATHSDARDMILEGAEFDHNSSVREICSQPSLQAYFNYIGDIPPSGFVDYLKALGYDDESHISFIWNLCQQEYINQHQGIWSQDLVGGGMQPGDLLSVLRDAVGWLMGSGSTSYSQSKDIARTLDSYFASDRDVWTLNNKISQLDLRIQVLERTMESVSAEAYCQAKLDMMKQYNLTGVKCGINSTIYWNAKKAGFDNYDTIAYKDCNEDWVCVKWSDCVDGTQTRKCVDKNDCGTFTDKPAETQTCQVSSQQTTLPQSIAPTTSKSVAKVESFMTMSQLIAENYMSILIMALISIPSVLIIVGIKKDLSTKRRRR